MRRMRGVRPALIESLSWGEIYSLWDSNIIAYSDFFCRLGRWPRYAIGDRGYNC